MLERPQRPSVLTPPTAAAEQQIVQDRTRRRTLDSRLTEYRRQRSFSPVDPATSRGTLGGAYRDYSYRRPSYVHARYYDRPDLIRHDYRHLYTYYDSHYRLHHRVIWPSYYYPIYYRFGPRVICHDVFPYYHRKYVFISLGGFWPDYTYLRYYWYGWHPYVWYGYYPIAREVPGDNYNYYTYNYYYQNDDGSYSSYSSDAPVDQSTWADVRTKLDQQAAQPAPQTLADTRFEEGVESFEAANYDAAAGKFEEAVRLAPNDMILPFAYAQALFADGQYAESANVLRQALSKVSPEQEGVFYPRGLYANDDVLFGQVENLVDKLERSGSDADLQLLLGYQLLGVGETGYAREPLERAAQDPQNAAAAKVLLDLAAKVEKEAEESDAVVGGSDAAAQSQADVTPTPEVETTTGGAQLSSTPGVAPAQKMPEIKPQAAPNTDKTEGTPGADQAAPLTDRKEDGGAVPIVPPSGSGPSDKGPPALNQAGIALAPSGSDLLAGIGRYVRADFAVFAGIVLLSWVGVYMQWKHLGHA